MITAKIESVISRITGAREGCYFAWSEENGKDCPVKKIVSDDFRSQVFFFNGEDLRCRGCWKTGQLQIMKDSWHNKTFSD
ncbi:MAG: hypothetical protein IPN18_18640 [Ignavibacteriales bacterium]|nr:hypothetical protein [Ignavibacteriales bacterium]